MKLIGTTLAIAATLSLTTIAHAGDAVFSETIVKTHKSQGEVKTIDGATSRIAVTDTSIFVNMDTVDLVPGNVNTLWLVVVNNPDACETSPCTAKDVLKRSAIVDSDVGYAGGIIADENGHGRFAYHQTEGDLNGGWFANGLKASEAAEIHLVVNDHGPLIEGRIEDMLSTYRGGCTDESIPAPMPDTARAQGDAGPNQCRLVQFSIFAPAQPSS